MHIVIWLFYELIVFFKTMAYLFKQMCILVSRYMLLYHTIYKFVFDSIHYNNLLQTNPNPISKLFSKKIYNFFSSVYISNNYSSGKLPLKLFYLRNSFKSEENKNPMCKRNLLTSKEKD